MSKTHLLCCKLLHSLPKFATKPQRIQVGNGQFISILFIIPNTVDIYGQRFEIYVTGFEFGTQNGQHGSCITVEISWQGCWQVHRQISAALLHMHNAFPTEKWKQTILMSFSDITTTWLIQ